MKVRKALPGKIHHQKSMEGGIFGVKRTVVLSNPVT